MKKFLFCIVALLAMTSHGIKYKDQGKNTETISINASTKLSEPVGGVIFTNASGDTVTNNYSLLSSVVVGTTGDADNLAAYGVGGGLVDSEIPATSIISTWEGAFPHVADERTIEGNILSNAYDIGVIQETAGFLNSPTDRYYDIDSLEIDHSTYYGNPPSWWTESLDLWRGSNLWEQVVAATNGSYSNPEVFLLEPGGYTPSVSQNFTFRIPSHIVLVSRKQYELDKTKPINTTDHITQNPYGWKQTDTNSLENVVRMTKKDGPTYQDSILQADLDWLNDIEQTNVWIHGLVLGPGGNNQHLLDTSDYLTPLTNRVVVSECVINLSIDADISAAFINCAFERSFLPPLGSEGHAGLMVGCVITNDTYNDNCMRLIGGDNVNAITIIKDTLFGAGIRVQARAIANMGKVEWYDSTFLNMSNSFFGSEDFTLYATNCVFSNAQNWCASGQDFLSGSVLDSCQGVDSNAVVNQANLSMTNCTAADGTLLPDQ